MQENLKPILRVLKFSLYFKYRNSTFFWVELFVSLSYGYAHLKPIFWTKLLSCHVFAARVPAFKWAIRECGPMLKPQLDAKNRC